MSNDALPRRYWLSRNNETDGPFDIDTIHQMIAAGGATWDTLACAEGSRRWRPLQEFEEVRHWTGTAWGGAVEQGHEAAVGRPEAAWEVFAREAGIDLEEEPADRVPNVGAANAVIAELKEALPAVKSAYRPSGAMPGAAFAYMVAGALLAVPLAVLAAGVVGGIGAVLTWGTIWLSDQCGVICTLTVIFAALFALGGHILGYMAAGWTAGATVAGMGGAGKNRNRPVPAILSAGAAALASMAVWFLWRQFAELPVARLIGWDRDTVALVALIAASVGGVLAAGTAAYTAVERVEGAKFCEDCEVFMELSPLPTLTAGGLKAVVRAVNEDRMDIASDLMLAPRGRCGQMELYSCPRCNKGFLEVKANYSATYKDDENTDQQQTANWLAASVSLEDDEVKRFRHWVVGKKEGDET